MKDRERVSERERKDDGRCRRKCALEQNKNNCHLVQENWRQEFTARERKERRGSGRGEREGRWEGREGREGTGLMVLSYR